MSRQPLKPHDPLRGHSWRDGVEPAPDPTPAPQRQEQAIDAHGKEHLMMIRATAIIKRLYGLKGPLDWKPAIHDRKAKAVFDKLMAGEELPRHWRSQYREPPPINPLDWITVRQASR